MYMKKHLCKTNSNKKQTNKDCRNCETDFNRHHSFVHNFTDEVTDLYDNICYIELWQFKRVGVKASKLFKLVIKLYQN